MKLEYVSMPIRYYGTFEMQGSEFLYKSKRFGNVLRVKGNLELGSILIEGIEFDAYEHDIKRGKVVAWH